MKLKEKYKRYVELTKKQEISEQINKLYGKNSNELYAKFNYFISENEINELTELKDYFDKNIKLFNVNFSFFMKTLLKELNKFDGNKWQFDIKTIKNEYDRDNYFGCDSYNHTVYLIKDNYSFSTPIANFKYVFFTDSYLVQELISNNNGKVQFNLLKEAEKMFSPSGADDKSELTEKINEIVWEIIEETVKNKRINEILNRQKKIKEFQTKINSLKKEINDIEKESVEL